MVSRAMHRRILAMGLMCATAGTAVASGTGNQPKIPPNNAATSSATVEWLVPALPSTQPQTAEQAEASKQSGRELPKPEMLQPTLDPALPAYVPGKGVTKLKGQFHGASSDVLVSLVKAWASRFKALHPGVDIDIAPPYAGSLGAKELIKEKTDFVFVSRELKPEDLVDFHAKFGYDPLSVPVSGGSYRHFGFLDAIGVFVHPDNPLRQIDYKQLDALFSSTRYRGGQAITTWGQLGLGGEWADKPVHLYGIKPWNGFEEFFRQRVLSRDGQRGEWRDGIHYEKTVFPLAKSVAADRYALGYSGLAYIDASVKMLPIATGHDEAAVAPTYENVASAKYPLSRLIFFNVNKAPDKPMTPALREFLRFILSKEGQQIVLDQQVFLPLRAEQVQHSRTLLEP